MPTPSDAPISVDCAAYLTAIESVDGEVLFGEGDYVYRPPICGTSGVFESTAHELLNVRSLADIDAVRALLYQELFALDTLPTTGADSIVPAEDTDANGTFDRYVFAMFAGNVSRARFYRTSATPSGWLVVHHGGHGNHSPVHADCAPVIQACLAAGHDVFALSMPGNGVDNAASGNLGSHQNGWIYERNRRDLVSWGGAGVPPHSAIGIFVAPVHRALNALASGYDRVAITGLSGGGWTSHVCAALDERITASYPVAGALPSFARVQAPVIAPHGDIGDFEQCHRTLYDVANWEDILVMGCSRGRRQMHITNAGDTCCFVNDGSTFAAALAYEAAVAASGRYGYWQDQAADRHEYTAEAIAAVLADMSAIARRDARRVAGVSRSIRGGRLRDEALARFVSQGPHSGMPARTAYPQPKRSPGKPPAKVPQPASKSPKAKRPARKSRGAA